MSRQTLALLSAVLASLAVLPASAAALSGEQVVAQQCGTCHAAGIAGAPKIGDKAAWAARLKAAGSVDALVASAIKGKNAMPPRGGNPARTDAEMKAAVEFMLK
jgi:cytochrome c5